MTNPIAKLAVNGGIKFANDSDACVATKSGTMRYTGTALQFCDGTTWQNINLGTAGLIPSGAIQAFYLSSCPSGWSPANGSNGTPDLRGEFVRGLDGGRGVDAGRTLGSWQNHTIQDHKHYIV